MARLQGLLKRPSKAEQLELELARQGSVARLERLLAQRAGTFTDDEEESAEPDGFVDPAEVPADPAEAPHVTAGSPDPPEAPEPTASSASGSPHEDAEIPWSAAAGVPVMAPDHNYAVRPAIRRQGSAVEVKDEWDRSVTSGTDNETGPDPDQEASPATAALREVDVPMTIETMAPIETTAPIADESLAAPVGPAKVTRARRTSVTKTDSESTPAADIKAASTRSKSSGKRSSDPPPPPRVRVAPSGAVHPKRAPRQPRQPAVLAACPSCAVLLEPRPTASRRCSHCRERIVVKRLDGGVLYLTVAAATALEAGQRRIKVTARLARIRDRWLTQASAVGASPAAIERIGRVTATEEGVEAARALYLGAANRAFVAANRERRFAEAASIRRAHVQALLRERGAADPVTDEIIGMYRDAMSAELKSQREFGRDVELVGAACCEACDVDSGLVVRITEEIKATRLPHAGCPKGVCLCRWVPARVAGRRTAVKAGSVR